MDMEKQFLLFAQVIVPLESKYKSVFNQKETAVKKKKKKKTFNEDSLFSNPKLYWDSIFYISIYCSECVECAILVPFFILPIGLSDLNRLAWNVKGIFHLTQM